MRCFDQAQALMTSDGSLIAGLTAEDLIMACLQDREMSSDLTCVCVFSSWLLLLDRLKGLIVLPCAALFLLRVLMSVVTVY